MSNINNELVVRALNYHGQQLTSFMKETPVYSELELKNVDYHLYQGRSRELRMEDRGKRLLLHRFISQNVEKLYKNNSSSNNYSSVKLDNDHTEELAALLPPFEVFTSVDEDDRCRHFFDCISAGDVLLCRVVQKSMSGLMLSALCLDPVTDKSRYIEDLKIRCFCPTAEMIPASDPRDPVRSYEAGDIVRVVCLEVKLDSQRLLAGMKSSSLRAEMAGVVKLGLCPQPQLPASFSYSSQAIQRKIPFTMFLEKSVGFINPTNVTHLASELGLDHKGDSLMKSLSGKYRPETYASSIRRDQASRWAFKHVAQGIKYFKAGNNVEAFQCLNQALNIDADNVEGLVARGALYANNGGLDKAVEDFEKALNLNRNHKNARKYLCETLIAVARNNEDENKVETAIETYQRILTIVPDHKEALDSIYFLRGKPKDAPLRDDPKHSSDNKNKPKLALEEERRADKSSERRKKKKKRRHSSAASSSSSSGSHDDVRRSSKKKKKKDHKSRSKSPSPPPSKSHQRAMSPFSAKMAPSSSGAPAGGSSMNMPEGIQTNSVTPGKQSMNLPLPDLREDIERIRNQRQGDPPPVKTDPPAPGVPPGFPMIDLTKPPPGYHPPPAAGQFSEQDYDEKVRRFLQNTQQGGSSSSSRRRSGHNASRRSRSRRRSSRKSRSRSKSKHNKSRKSRSRSRSKHSKSRRRSRSKSSEKKKSRKSRSRSGEKKRDKSKSKERREPILIEDDDFDKKLNEHLSSKDKKRSRSRSKDKKSRRSRSRSKDRRSRRSRGSKSRSRSRDKKSKSDKAKDDKEKSEKLRTPSGGGMWIPTGEDSLIDGVKEAIKKVEKKERRRSGDDRGSRTDDKPKAAEVEYEIKYDRRTGMYTRVAKEANDHSEKAEDVVELESRVIRQISQSPPKLPSKKESPNKDKEKKRSKSRDKERKRSKSKDKRRSRSRNRGRSRSRRRSSSRSKRNRSRSRRRSKSRRSSNRSKSRGRRCRSRSRRRSRTKSGDWRDRKDYKDTQSSLKKEHSNSKPAPGKKNPHSNL